MITLKGAIMKNRPKVMLMIEDSRSYGRGLLRGISRYVRIHTPWEIISPLSSYKDGDYIFKKTIQKEVPYDGAIIRELDKKTMSSIMGLKVPIIAVRHTSEAIEWPGIITNCEEIGRIGANHFIDRGFKNFGYCGLGNMCWSRHREASFGKNVAQAGGKFFAYRQPPNKKNRVWEAEKPILVKWLRELPKPIGIMTCTDDRALGVIDACMIAEIQVPEEVAILGVDDDHLVCDMAAVPISSISLNSQKAGFQAASLLSEMMEGKQASVDKITVEPIRVNVRRSTDTTMIMDSYVAKALNYINRHINEPLQVSEVARNVALSERNLYDRFHKELGRTVYQQIAHLRIEKICHLLSEPSMSIARIAYTMGYPNDKHLSRFFRRHKNMSPGAWRKKKVATI